jgi:hypothetical protein
MPAVVVSAARSRLPLPTGQAATVTNPVPLDEFERRRSTAAVGAARPREATQVAAPLCHAAPRGGAANSESSANRPGERARRTPRGRCARGRVRTRGPAHFLCNAQSANRE